MAKRFHVAQWLLEEKHYRFHVKELGIKLLKTIWKGMETMGNEDPAPAPEPGSSNVSKRLKAAKAAHQIESDCEDEGGKAPDQGECSFWSCPGEGHQQSKPPEEFRSRPEFVQLQSEGLTRVPGVPGCGIFLHKSSCQWHSRYGLSAEKNTAPTYSEHLRSPRKALLLALIGMWKWYSTHTKQKSHVEHLSKLQQALDDTPFWKKYFHHSMIKTYMWKWFKDWRIIPSVWPCVKTAARVCFVECGYLNRNLKDRNIRNRHKQTSLLLLGSSWIGAWCSMLTLLEAVIIMVVSNNRSWPNGMQWSHTQVACKLCRH